MDISVAKWGLAPAIALGLIGCGGGSGGSSSRTVAQESKTIAEGTTLSYTLSQGTYTAEITSSNNGVTVQWLGSPDCAGTSTEMKVYGKTCTLSQQGQLVITNPTTFGLGGNEIVAIKVTTP